MAACVINTQTYFAKGQLLNAWISIAIMAMVGVVIADNIKQWFALVKTKQPVGLCCAVN